MSAPDPTRLYFPQPRARATAPRVDAPTLADIVWSYFDDLDHPSTPNQ